MIRYLCDEDNKDYMETECGDNFCFFQTIAADINATKQGVVLDRDAVAALVGQLTSWLERTRRTDGK